MDKADCRACQPSAFLPWPPRAAPFIFRFKAKNTEFREQTLRNQASLITDYLKKAPPGPLELPQDVIDRFKANNGRYAIIDRNGTLLTASPGLTEALTATNASATPQFLRSSARAKTRRPITGSQ